MTKSEKSKKRSTWVKIAIFASVIFFIMWKSRQDITEMLIFIADRETFQTYISSFGIWGPLVLALFQVLQTVVALIPGHAVVMAAGYMYGLWPGFLINWVSIISACMLAYWIGRWGGRPIAARLAPAEVINRWDNASEEHGLVFFLTAFLLPVFPADTMNYVAGLSSISAKKFFIANAIGRTPAIFSLTLMGSFGLELASLNIPVWEWVLIILTFIGLYIVWQYFFQSTRKKLKFNKIRSKGFENTLQSIKLKLILIFVYPILLSVHVYILLKAKIYQIFPFRTGKPTI